MLSFRVHHLYLLCNLCFTGIYPQRGCQEGKKPGKQEQQASRNIGPQ